MINSNKQGQNNDTKTTTKTTSKATTSTITTISTTTTATVEQLQKLNDNNNFYNKTISKELGCDLIVISLVFYYFEKNAFNLHVVSL